MTERLKNRLRQKLNPHWRERQGRKSAGPVLASNRIASPAAAEAVMKTALDFSEFQGLALYRPKGYFPKRVDYREEMPLLPQMLSPFFGKVVGELAFAGYASMTYPEAPKPAFLSLGAGRAYLDHDLIEHVAGGSFQLTGYESGADAFRKESTFRVTDLGRKAVSLAKKELAEVIGSPRLRGRVRVEELDALNFRLPEAPFGIVYCNELIDNLLAEPIISVDGALYATKVVACDLQGAGGDNAYTRIIERNVPLRGVISREQARTRIDEEDFGKMGFAPVFVPLEYDVKLNEHVGGLKSAARIDEDDFGGVYPVHIRLDNMFACVRKSFARGMVIIIDYPSCRGGWHNWNVAVNNFGHYRFGEEDIDFQIDSRQVVEKAERSGLRCEYHTDLATAMNKMKALVTEAGTDEIKRNMRANGYPFSEESREAYLMMHAELIGCVAPSYDLLAFHF
jgi:SAM-dependent MidA family methyltransferase